MEENKIKPPKLPISAKEKPSKPPKQEAPQPDVLNSQVVENENPVLVTSSKKKKLLTIFAIILIAIIVASTIYVIVKPKPTSPLDINIDFVVGSEIKFDEETELANRKVLPGDTLKSKFFVKSVADENNANSAVFVRVSVYASVDGRVYRNMFKFVTTEDWIMGADGYFYMYGTLKANEMVEVTSNLILDEKIGNEMQGKTLTITFVGECLQAGEDGFSAIQSYWKSAPTQWKNSQKDIKG